MPALKNPREMGGGLDVIFQSKGIYTQLILCHLSLTIFADFWDLGAGQVPHSPPRGTATVQLHQGPSECNGDRYGISQGD